MRFYNSGKFLHQIGRHKDTGEMVESIKDLQPDGYDIGTAIVNFPGHQLRKVVPAGEWVDLPDDLSAHMVKSQCPALLTEKEAAALTANADKAAKPKADKGADKGAKDKE